MLSGANSLHVCLGFLPSAFLGLYPNVFGANIFFIGSSISGVTSEPPANLSRSLTKRLDNLKSQYQRDLLPLTQQREALTREVMELKAARDVFLEETTVLNARNEELAQLSAQYSRRVAMVPPNGPSNSNGTETSSKNIGPMIVETPVRIDSRNIQQQQTPQQSHQLSAYSSVEEFDARKTKVEEIHTPSRGPVKVFKWGSRAKEVSAPIAQSATEKVKIGHMEHSFQPLSLLRFTRCDHCGEKMWGSQLRCMGCSISVHTRCVNQVHSACSPQTHNPSGSGNNEDSQPLRECLLSSLSVSFLTVLFRISTINVRSRSDRASPC